jgi:hypothetical protein
MDPPNHNRNNPTIPRGSQKTMQAPYLLPVTYVTMSAVSALLIFLVRLPMGEPHWTAMLKAFLLAGAVMLTWQESAQQVLSRRWCSYALALLATLSVLSSPVLIWLGDAVGGVLLYTTLGALWLIGLRRVVIQIGNLPLWYTLTAVMIGIALGIAFFFITNIKGYANIFTPEQALLGLQHRDTLYHASLAAMFAKYGVPSTGLDGLPLEQFHFLTHAWSGLIARWMGVAPIHVNYLEQQILGVPLLFFSLSAAVYWLERPQNVQARGFLTVTVPIALLLLFQRWDWAHYLTSESFCLSLILLLLTLPLLIELLERPQITCGTVRYIALGIALIVMLYTKTLVGVIFSAGLFYAFIRTYGLSLFNLVKYATPIAIVAWFAVMTTVQPSARSPSIIDPFHFLVTYPDGAWPNIIAFALVLTAALVLWAITKDSPRVVIETVIVLMFASIVPALLLRMPFGSAYYFINVGVWIGIAFAAGALLIPRLAALERSAVVSAGAVFVVVLGLLTNLNSGPSKLLALMNRLEEREDQPQLLPSLISESWVQLFDPNDPHRTRIADMARRSIGGQIREALVDAGLPDSYDTLVFVSPKNTAFWKLNDQCAAQPFFVPATVSAPMINGLQPQGECPTPHDGWFGYGPYSESSRSKPLSEGELCEKASKLGFKRVVIMKSPRQLRDLQCNRSL